MQVRATNNSAALTGVSAGILGLILGPRIDAGGALWLLFGTAAVAGPAYFFVFGLRRSDMVGLWMFQPSVLKRLALWFAGALCVGALAQIYFLIRSGVTA